MSGGGKMGLEDIDHAGACTVQCGFLWGFFGGVAGFVVFILFGVLALVPAGPFDGKAMTLGIVLLVLGGTGIASHAGYLLIGLPCAGVGFIMDQALSNV
ncbi:hypothetical protein R1flu_014044 [Riccia fluitans]|uniref:Transmembrane protein n=1 Tax=Riccia fluitans TaxID=41844 RepID=A0ABD1YEZ7_9MARC